MIFLFTFNEYSVSEWSYIDNCEDLFIYRTVYLGQWHCLYHQGAMLIPSSQIMTGLFCLLDIISLAPCCERDPAYSQLVSDVVVMFLSLHMLGLWELSWMLHTPYWRHVSTSDSNMICSLCPIWPGWSLNWKHWIRSTCIPLHIYGVFKLFWK